MLPPPPVVVPPVPVPVLVVPPSPVVPVPLVAPPVPLDAVTEPVDPTLAPVLLVTEPLVTVSVVGAPVVVDPMLALELSVEVSFDDAVDALFEGSPQLMIHPQLTIASESASNGVLAAENSSRRIALVLSSGARGVQRNQAPIDKDPTVHDCAVDGTPVFREPQRTIQGQFAA